MILVTGATGLNGSAVVREFARQGVPVRALARNRTKAGALERLPGVAIAEGDMLLPHTLGAALDGIERLLLISSAEPKLVETQCSFIDAAKQAGVRHIVKFSGLNASPSSAFRFTRMHGQIEKYLESSWLAWTHLRPSQFMQVHFREVPTIIAAHTIFLPMENARIAPVDVEDIAKVAVALLQSNGTEGKIYEMTGPEALTMSEVAERLSQALGETIGYVNVSAAAKREALLTASVKPEFADAMDELFAERRRGIESRVLPETHKAFGVSPTFFLDFARRNAAVFRGETVSGPTP